MCLPPLKQLDDYEEVFLCNTEFGSSYGPDAIEGALLQTLRAKGIEAAVDGSKYKYKFTVHIEDTTGEFDLDVKIRILKKDEQINVVEIKRAEGNHLKFIDFYKDLKSEGMK
jgi:hypothetical protein